jgi:hypothetical protein
MRKYKWMMIYRKIIRCHTKRKIDHDRSVCNFESGLNPVIAAYETMREEAMKEKAVFRKTKTGLIIL